MKDFLNLHMCVYLRSKLQVSRIILTSFRKVVILPTPNIAKRTPKRPTQITIKIKKKKSSWNYEKIETAWKWKYDLRKTFQINIYLKYI